MSRRAVLKALLSMGIGATSGAAGYGYLYERHRVDVTRTLVPVPNLPDGLAGLRIGVLTDIHLSPTVPAALVQHAVDLVQREAPDVIFLLGDFVSWKDQTFLEPVAEILKRLTAQHGVFAVPGNHDHEAGLARALTARHITVLRDARSTIEVNHEAIDVAGLSFWTRDQQSLSRVLAGGRGTPFLLAHDPRRVREARALNVPLVVSGHTHGGQVVFPALGPVFTARRFPVAAGLLQSHGTSLFVSRGIGTVYVPVRINCPPEVALLTLKRSA